MKKIGIIFAMNEELMAVKNKINITKEFNIYELKFFEGTIENKDCILVECGVGKVNAARTAQILIDLCSVDFIINVGIAGGVDESLNILDTVIATKVVQHDFDITVFNHKKGYIPNIGDFITVNPNDVLFAKNLLNDKDNIKFGTIASGDIFCTDVSMSRKINKKFNALCVEMEGASIAQVCKLCNIPFLIVRSISDVPNNNNVITYNEFLDKSTIIVSNVLFKIISNM